MAKHPIGHRSSEFSAILKEVYEDLKWIFQTKNDVYIYTASGTGAMEAALSNLFQLYLQENSPVRKGLWACIQTPGRQLR